MLMLLSFPAKRLHQTKENQPAAQDRTTDFKELVDSTGKKVAQLKKSTILLGISSFETRNPFYIEEKFQEFLV